MSIDHRTSSTGDADRPPPGDTGPATPDGGVPPVLADSSAQVAEREEGLLSRLRQTRRDARRGVANEDEVGRLDPWIIGVVGAIVVGLVVWGFASPSSLSTVASDALAWVLDSAGWLYVLVASFFVVFVLWLAVGRFGRIPLGRDGEAPEFSTGSWISMMFACGMGIGLMFFGVAEPLTHYVTPPPGTVQGQSPAALQTAMATSLFHWTLHPWAIYAVVGIAIAYSTFRLGRKNLLSEAFVPMFGRRGVDGWGGKVINMLAIFATLFGSAASLGLGALQIGAGLQFNGVIGQSATPVLVFIIALLTAAFVASAVSGIARGIQWLANTNAVLAVVLAVFIFVAGPTLFILNVIPAAIGDYFRDLAEMASRTSATGGDGMAAWLSGWTIFYWAWWISWTPFVGLFIARISRGRTIRQFVTGVLLVPSLISVLWFAIFGGTAIKLLQDNPDGGLAQAVADSSSTIYVMFQNLSLPPWLLGVLVVLAMVLTAIFFVTGADSASIVMGSLSSNGTMEPKKPLVVFWGVLMGAVAAVMLLAGGDQPDAALTGLQNITIVSSLPFVIVMVLLCVALVKDLQKDPIWLRRQLSESVMRRTIRDAVDEHGHQKFDLVTRRSDAPDTGSFPAVDATAGGEPIYADRGRRRFRFPWQRD
ncbi:choline transporter [Tersicoccus phoenicis]|uniref:Choline transporter n=1 Tax=Tersicoccus phoenicis TaxID=554083 RepID=A0A1R1L6I9_9MICC|nr:BCCT family transporter [Tersicoccus phoenicis]OMH23150.1 choline transporter [Tersicoccus phoenicis]